MDTIWVFAQPEGNSAEAGRWCLLTLTSPVGHEAALVAGGWHVVGQLLDVSRLSAEERDELGDLLSKSSRKREESGLACRERELLSRVPRLSAPGIDVDHAIKRYVLRGPDGEEIAALDVSTQEAKDEARRSIGSIAEVEVKDGVKLRLAWSGGPERAGLHADRGLADESAAKPCLLWALLERTKAVCAQAGVQTSEVVARRSLRAVASDLRREGWPVRERRAAGSDSGEAITRHAGDKLLVVEVDAPISPDRAKMLLDRVRRSIPPVWADLVPLNHHPGSRGRLFRPLGGHHKTWSSENSGARKVLVDPDAPAPTPITAAVLRPFLAAAEARLARESAATASRRCKGPASPEAVEAARQRREELPTKTTVHGRDLIYRDVLPTELAEALESWAEEHGAAYVNGGNWHQAELGITGVLASEGIAAEVIGDLLYLAAMSGARSDPEVAAAEGERSARGVLEGGRSPGGLGLVREWVGDCAADDLALLAVALAGAENRELLLALPGRMALDERAVGYPDVLDAIRWAQQNDPPTFLWIRMQFSKKGIWRELMRFVHERGRDLAAGQSGDHSSDRYIEDDGKLYEVTHSDRGEARRLLANFTARISEEVHEDDGSGENRSCFEIVAVLHDHDEHRCRVPAAQFGLMQWVSDQLGASAILEPGAGVREQVRHAIQILSLPVPRRCLYTHLGWRQLTSGWAYLHAGGALGASGPVPDVEVAPPDALSRFRLPAPPDGSELALAVRASLEMLRVADARLTLPLWASVYRSVLGETRFSLFLLGTTGTRKSCLTALAQQHFGLGMSFDALPCSWEATANALEGIAFAAKDAVLAVDDFRPRGSSAEQARLQAAADRLFRSQANNAGRQRMRDDLSHRPPRPPRGLVVSSGEELPHGASCQARLLVLRVGAGSVNLDALTRSQEHAANGLFVQALAGFIRWLAPRYEVLAGALRSDADAMRVAFDLPGAHGRTPGAAADLQVAIRCFAKFAVEVGAITTVDADRLTESARATLREVVSEQIELLGSTDPVTRLLRLLVEAFAGGAAHVAGCNDRVPLRNKTSLGWRRADEGSETVRDNGRSMRDTSESWQAQGARVGWVDGEDLYLLPDATIAIVRRAVEATGEAWSTTERAMAEMLRERGLLRSHERARATQRVPRLVTSGRPRAWHLSVRSIGLTEDEIDGA